jgi:hypothetical protein
MGVKLFELHKAVDRFDSFVKAQREAPANVVAAERLETNDDAANESRRHSRIAHRCGRSSLARWSLSPG